MLITKDVSRIASLLKDNKGSVVAYPTETFYGLGALIKDHAAIKRIISIKGRDAAKGMIVLASDMDMVSLLAHMDNQHRELLQRFWPGPLSAVMKAKPGLDPVLGPNSRIAIRISPDATALSLIREAGPITSTSANISGIPASCSPDDIKAQDLDIDAILDGGITPGGKPSTLIDLTVWPPLCLREGAIPFEAILDALIMV